MSTLLRFTAILLLVFSLFHTQRAFSQQKTGLISGEVRDATTKQPLPMANVFVVSTNFGAASDENGRFVIRDVPSGNYEIRSSYIGYKPATYTDVVVSQSRTTTVSVELVSSQIEMNEVTVTGGYFERPAEKALSVRTLSSQEIRRSPGSAEDIFRVMQSLPGVATAGGKSAQLIVRGGSPDENLTLLDNIEIYNPIHFARTGESMGIISIINPSLLESVDFMTGGFPASYGDKMSSVFDMKMVEGNKELHNLDVNTNIAGFGALVNGPAPGGGTMLFSARRGFFDLLTSLMNRPAAPRYYDAVGKVTYDLNEKNRVNILGFYYLDQIERTGSMPGSLQGSKYDYLTRDDFGSAAGLNWRYLFSTNAYSLTTFSFSGNGWNTLQGTETNRSARGENIREYSYSLKNEISYQPQPEFQLKGGLQLHLIDSKHNAWTPEDTTRSGQLISGTTISYLPPSATKLSFFLQDTWTPFARFSLTTGIRYDYFSFSREATWSPRFSAQYHFSEQTSLNAAYGKFFQTPASYQIALHPLNESLRSSLATHYILGLEHLFSEDTRATLEVYRKDLASVVIENDSTNILDNKGSGYAEGIELSFQKKFTRGFVGSASYSYSVSKRRDTDEFPLYDFEFDRPHIVNLIAGIELSDHWQLGIKFQFASGNPYTPVIGAAKKGGVFYVVDGERNSARYPDYHKLDIRLDRTFEFASWTLTAYLDLWNVYNRENVLAYSYKVDAAGALTTNTRLDFGILPIIGLSAKF